METIKIILAEDHALMRAGTRHILEQYPDLEVVGEAEDGQQAVELIKSHKPDIAILDIRMPKVDGVEVLKQLKSHPEWKNMPVIMLTTTDDPREIHKCYNLGCSCYVTKPVDYQKFSEMLTRLGLFLLVVQVPNLNDV